MQHKILGHTYCTQAIIEDDHLPQSKPQIANIVFNHTLLGHSTNTIYMLPTCLTIQHHIYVAYVLDNYCVLEGSFPTNQKPVNSKEQHVIDRLAFII